MKGRYFFSFIPCALFIAVIAFVGGADAASVAKRGTVSRAKVTAAARAPVASKPVVEETVVEETVVEPGGAQEEVAEEVFEFENRTSQFDSALGADGDASGATSDEDLAKMIRQQREALNASTATTVATDAVRTSMVSGQNACDTGLRKCMTAKCGADFAKCAGDTDTLWGDKMDACRRDLKCTGNEYKLFAAEIKADRDANAELANFNAIINCGNKYNSCIIAECGATFSKCLGKAAGDAAIAKCKKIQTECTQMDNGLASRMMNVFAAFRQDAEKQILRDEARLYDLRDEMESVCRRMGAMFDQRSLDCVYTVNFFADNATTPYASKKAYAGGVFSCDPGWFGVDVTTFKENAYRLTRAQTAASSAMLGSGIGMAAGAITSGAIDRALETQKAKKALKEAEAGDKPDKKDRKSKDASDDTEDEESEDDNKPGAVGRRCVNAGGKWENGQCVDPKCKGKKTWDANKNKCVNDKEESKKEDSKKDESKKEPSAREKKCKERDGEWEEGGTCKCVNSAGNTIQTKNPGTYCVKKTGKTVKDRNSGKKKAEEQPAEKEEAAKSLDTRAAMAALMCNNAKGTWKDGKCVGAQCGAKKIWSDDAGKCIDDISDEISAKMVCEDMLNKGTWNSSTKTCDCGGERMWDENSKKCK